MENKIVKEGSATLTLDGKTVELPVLKGSVGPDVIDIRKLYGETDAFTTRLNRLASELISTAALVTTSSMAEPVS